MQKKSKTTLFLILALTKVVPFLQQSLKIGIIMAIIVVLIMFFILTKIVAKKE